VKGIQLYCRPGGGVILLSEATFKIAAVAQGPEDPADKAPRIDAMLKEITDEEQRARQEVDKAQGDFAAEHKLSLVQELSDKKK